MRRTLKRLSEVMEQAPVVSFNQCSKMVIMSDCHRGTANRGDNFAPNENLFFAALQYYYKNGFAYIELGDGDELWENRCMERIIYTYDEVFRLLSKFYKEHRFLMVSGNHDKEKEKAGFTAQKCQELFPGVKIREGIRLKYECTGREIFLTHGHQGDLLNDTWWRIGRFLVRYVWRPLELFGVNDPTDAGKNDKKANRVERKLIKWVENNDVTLVTGHTHKPRIAEQLPAYLNTGSCVQPRCITALELENGEITLVKWVIRVREDQVLKVEKEIVGKHVKIV